MECRIAWCDKITNSYLQGHWRSKSDIGVIHAWCVCQNIHRYNEYYWVEIKADGKITNYTYIPPKQNNVEKEYVEIDYKKNEVN
jgi:hypothetical protein|uniref:Uncharacterized protein n=1 Tax=viral metagenome TaxID=1070528 RepID=A0A6C0IPU0_9ZZZZ